jgi:uncharacterized SAM-binding protein YcdF (DUF218 family)
MFVVKKFVTFFLDPLHMGLTLSLVGLVMLWFFHGRRERQGRWLVTVGILWICLFGMDAVAKVLMAPLENPYLPVKQVVVNASHPVPQFIVVMAAGHRADPAQPVSSALKFPALQRLVEGIRLHRQFPDSKLVLSGGLISYGKKECETMQEMALELGVNQSSIILEGDSRDSKDQARNLKSILRTKPFLLVTSGNHMSRASALFEGQGLAPILAPTAFITSQDDPDSFGIPFPHIGSLGTSHRALHEYLGLFWAKIRGQM